MTMEGQDRILDQKAMADQCSRWREAGQTVVFTNGVFDLLHRGHVTYLEAAARLGDVLVVGVNDDASVRRLGKGDDRPIVPEGDRAEWKDHHFEILGAAGCQVPRGWFPFLRKRSPGHRYEVTGTSDERRTEG